MSKKERILKESFGFDGGTDDYSFQIKKKHGLWWLLLLLLPLLLLIPFKKDVTVLTQFNGDPVPFVDVSMNYTGHYLLWDSHFMVDRTFDTIQQTDEEGKTVFKDLGYSLYSFIFHHNAPIVFHVEGGECFSPIDESHQFHKTRKVKLEMDPLAEDVRLKVVDSELGYEIPEANLEIEYDSRGGRQVVTVTTDAAGCVVLADAWLCGSFGSIKASADGYADTLLGEQPVKKMLANNSGYLIPLRPLKDRFTFFVKNKFTKQPVPDAVAEVTLTVNGKTGSSGKMRTNVDGLGQGFFDDARVLAIVDIVASKQPLYRDGRFVSPTGKDLTVREFKALPDSLRVVWLEPEPQAVDFRNLDTVSGKPISGVRNEIIVEGVDGTVRNSVETSNRNGYFPVRAVQGDKITIVSTLDPYYIPKTTVIDHFQQAEVIYLRPIMVSLEFRTVEQADGRILGELADCGLEITVDGNKVSPTNSGSGSFMVKNLRLSSAISIVATKPGYNTNRTKVRNRNVGDLYRARQEERDIPLDIERVCGQRYSSDAVPGKSTMSLHIMGKSSGRFKFMFRTRAVADEIEVWNCRPNEIATADRKKCLLFKWTLNDGDAGRTPPGDYRGQLMDGFSPETRWLNFNNGPYITVVGVRSDSSSNFDYVVCCPDEDCEVSWAL